MAGETKEIIGVPGLKPDDKVVIKKFSYNDFAVLQGKLARVKMFGQRNTDDSDVNVEGGAIWMLVLGIKYAPFFEQDFTREQKEKVIRADSFDPKIGEYLFRAISEYNEMGDIGELSKK